MSKRCISQMVLRKNLGASSVWGDNLNKQHTIVKSIRRHKASVSVWDRVRRDILIPLTYPGWGDIVTDSISTVKILIERTLRDYNKYLSPPVMTDSVGIPYHLTYESSLINA